MPPDPNTTLVRCLYGWEFRLNDIPYHTVVTDVSYGRYLSYLLLTLAFAKKYLDVTLNLGSNFLTTIDTD